MVNQTSSIAAALLDRAVSLDVKLDEAYTIWQIFQTAQTKAVYKEVYQQMLDAYATYWRIEKKLS